MCELYQICPNEPIPGLWEVPIHVYSGLNFSFADTMNHDLKYLPDMNFDFSRSFNKNKVPKGFYLHFNYFTENLQFMKMDMKKTNFVADFYE